MLACIQVALSYECDPTNSRTIDLNSLELVDHKSCLHYLAELQKFELLNMLVTESKAMSDLNVRDVNGNTVLHVLAEANAGTQVHQKSIMILLDKGIAPDMKNNHGVTVSRI